MALGSCSPSSVTAQDTQPVIAPIDDEGAPLRDPYIFVFEGKQDFITVRPGDRGMQIVRFENAAFHGVIGQDGEGPCEQMDVTAMDVQVDTLVTLDAHQGRILVHDLVSGDCLTSYTDPAPRPMNGIVAGEIGFYLSFGQFSSRTPSDTPLFYRFDRSKQELIPYEELSVQDVEHAVLPMAANTPLPMGKTENAIWFTPTLTGQVYSFDKASFTIDQFPAEVPVPDLQDYNLNSAEAVAELMDEELPFIDQLHLMPSGDLVVAVREGAFGTPMVQRYNANGELRAEQQFSPDTRIVNLDDTAITLLVVREDEPEQPYALEHKPLP